MTEKTAMQELWDYIDANYHEENFNLYSAKKLSIEKVKLQIIDATYYGHLKGWVDDGVENSYGEQYYNETFKSE